MPTLGKYEIVRRLTDRGISERYLARTGGETVVVYRLLPKLAQQAEVARAFVGDARLAQALDHPNVLRVREVGKSADGVFFVGEYARGATLAAVSAAAQARGRAMDPSIATLIIARLCGGLHEAHMLSNDEGIPLGLMHCAVSAENVLITRSGEVKLRSFGIGRALTLATKLMPELRDAGAEYLSPEQCRGATLDPRTDIYSTGTLLCELLCGRSPFARETPEATREAILEGTLPGELRSDVPAELEEIVSRALADDRRQRYVTAQDMQLALDAAMRKNDWDADAPELAAEINALLGPARPGANPPALPGEPAPAATPPAAKPPAAKPPKAVDSAPAFFPPPLAEPDDDADPVERTLGAGFEPDVDPALDAELEIPTLHDARAEAEAAGAGTDTGPGGTGLGGGLLGVPTVQNEEVVAKAAAAAEAAEAAAAAAAAAEASAKAKPEPPVAQRDRLSSEVLLKPLLEADPLPKELTTHEVRTLRKEPDTPPPTPAVPLPAPAAAPGGTRSRQLMIVIAAAVLLLGVIALGVVMLLPSAEQRRAELRIESDPSGASVFVDGRERHGVTPLTLVDLREGREYRVVLMAADHTPHESRITLEPGTRRTLRARLEPVATAGNARLLVEAPERAKVYMDSELRGSGTVEIDRVKPGVRHLVVVTLRGYENARLEIKPLVPGELRRIPVELTPRTVDKKRKKRQPPRHKRSGEITIKRGRGAVLGGQQGQTVPR